MSDFKTSFERQTGIVSPEKAKEYVQQYDPDLVYEATFHAETVGVRIYELENMRYLSVISTGSSSSNAVISQRIPTAGDIADWFSGHRLQADTLTVNVDTYNKIGRFL